MSGPDTRPDAVLRLRAMTEEFCRGPFDGWDCRELVLRLLGLLTGAAESPFWPLPGMFADLVGDALANSRRTVVQERIAKRLYESESVFGRLAWGDAGPEVRSDYFRRASLLLGSGGAP